MSPPSSANKARLVLADKLADDTSVPTISTDPTHITPLDLAWWLQLAPSLPWKYAVTMPQWPHSYVVRDKHLPAADFERAVRVIRTFGRPGRFLRQTRVYLTATVDGTPTKWWTMGEPLEECKIINVTTDLREYPAPSNTPASSAASPSTATSSSTAVPVPSVDTLNPAPYTDPIHTVYDDLAQVYDRRYDSVRCPDCQAENMWVWRLITDFFTGHPVTLDIGCGTGLALDLGLTSARHYTGLDPSQPMLNELIRKHPTTHRLMAAGFEQAHRRNAFRPKQFQLVTALFGSPSYIPPLVFPALADLASDLVVLMHYEEGYLPDYHTAIPAHLDTSRNAALDLARLYSPARPAAVVQLGHFVTTVLVNNPSRTITIPPLPSNTNHSPTAQVMAHPNHHPNPNGRTV